MMVSGDGKMLVAQDQDSVTSIYDLSRANKNRPLVLHRLAGNQYHGVSTFSFDNRTLATTINYELPSRQMIFRIQLWDTRTGKLKRIFQSNNQYIDYLAFSPDNQMLAGVSTRGTNLWDSRSGKFLRLLNTDRESIAFSPDGKVLASGGRQRIKLWDVRTGVLLRELVGHRGAVYALAFSPDGASLISGGDDGIVRKWRIK